MDGREYTIIVDNVCAFNQISNLQKGDRGEGGVYLKKVRSFMNKSMEELEGNLGFLCLSLPNKK